MSRRIQKHSLPRDNGSWSNRKTPRRQTQHSKNPVRNPLGASPQVAGGVSKANFGDNVTQAAQQKPISTDEIQHRTMLAGVPIRFRDLEGFEREGTVIRTMSIGYSVLPTTGRRTTVTPDRVLHN